MCCHLCFGQAWLPRATRMYFCSVSMCVRATLVVRGFSFFQDDGVRVSFSCLSHTTIGLSAGLLSCAYTVICFACKQLAIPAFCHNTFP